MSFGVPKSSNCLLGRAGNCGSGGSFPTCLPGLHMHGLLIWPFLVHQAKHTGTYKVMEDNLILSYELKKKHTPILAVL